jgi:hypothetical protein
VEAFGMLIKFKMSLPWKLRYQNNGVGAYLVPLNVDVTGNITANIVGVWSEFSMFCTLVTMATAANFNLCNPQKLPHTTVDIPAKFHEV